jgi:hypothetical protein
MKKKRTYMQKKYIKFLAQQIVESKLSYDRNTATMKHDDSDPDQRHGLYRDGKLIKAYNTKGEADNVKSRDPKFKDATVKKIAEGGMGGLNRAAPAQDVSYEKVLNDVTDTWKGQKVKVTEISASKKVEWADKATKYRDVETAKAQATGSVAPGVEKKTGDRAEKSMKIKHKYSAPVNEQYLQELSVNRLQNYSKGVGQMDPAITPKYKMVKHHEGRSKAENRIAHMTGNRNNKMYESKLQEFLNLIE